MQHASESTTSLPLHSKKTSVYTAVMTLLRISSISHCFQCVLLLYCNSVLQSAQLSAHRDILPGICMLVACCSMQNGEGPTLGASLKWKWDSSMAIPTSCIIFARDCPMHWRGPVLKARKRLDAALASSALPIGSISVAGSAQRSCTTQRHGTFVEACQIRVQVDASFKVAKPLCHQSACDAALLRRSCAL